MSTSGSSLSPALSYTGGCQCGAVRYRIQKGNQNESGGGGSSNDHQGQQSVDHRMATGVSPDESASSALLPLTADFCHCRMCQKAFGNVGAALARVPVSDLRWTRGSPSVFRSSSAVQRGFCDRCGTPLFMIEDDDDCYDVAVGTLDDPSLVTMKHQVGVESKLPWFDAVAGLPARSTLQERTSDDLATKLASRQHPDHDTAAWPT